MSLEEYGDHRKRGSDSIFNRAIIRKINDYKDSGKLLDIGCGSGHFLGLAQRFYQVYGIDISITGLNFSKKQLAPPRLCLANCEKLPFEEDFFDIIVSLDVVEHLKKPDFLFRECQRVLKNEGLLLIRTPNTNSLGHKLKGKSSFMYDNENHVSLLPISVWVKKLTDNNFVLEEWGTNGFWDTPYFKNIPNIFGKIIFSGGSKLLTKFSPIWPVLFGENFICLAKKA